MRDLGSKMAELKFEAPLAQFEDSDEWGGSEFITQTGGGTNASALKAALSDTLNLNLKETDNNILMLEEAVRDIHVSKNGSPNCNSISNGLGDGNGDDAPIAANHLGGVLPAATTATIKSKDANVDNFAEMFNGSLEDLVNTFDEKITKCFGNYEENVEELAPVQVRNQEEIMNECQ
ncbi:unnamed protein product [Hermetia illucens]|uniref:Uncharacterized protein n=2 Tax=Hermetia illucens TaxID=343691 RepID=A0A7R8UU49_HERIL|nr:unnamed protein product [Hermetia illucens]